MLAGMSNLMALAHAGDSNAPQFNAIFYATVATIIPVLFVAGALQADTYAMLLETSRAAYRRFKASDVTRQQASAYITWWVTTLIPVVILGYGVIGEIQALVNLYLQRTIGLTGPLLNGRLGPLVAAGGLTVAVAIGPAAKLYQTYRAGGPGNTAENPSGEEPHQHGTVTGEPPPPEGGKQPSEDR
jgi:heme/copper-type cytochrome/quinol oxidase subunit 2